MNTTRWLACLVMLSIPVGACSGNTASDPNAGGSSGSSGSAGSAGTGASGGAAGSGTGGASSGGAAGGVGTGGSAGTAGTGGIPGCPDPNDPKVHYYGNDPETCAVIDFACSPDQQYFSGACGCGCIDGCPDPNDPYVHYISHDPEACAAADWACGPGLTPFDNSCGCGCLGLNCWALGEDECKKSLVCMATYTGICDCACPNNEPGCPECPPHCFEFAGCSYSGE